jgi:hypothetical protein
MAHANRARTIRQDRSRRPARRATWLSAFATHWSILLRHGVGGRVGAAVLLLVCASLLTGARLGGAAGAMPSQQRAALRVSPPSGLPPVARWIDVSHGTSYTVRLQSLAAPAGAVLASAGFRFTYTTPTGDQLVAALPIAKQADGTYTQSTPVDPTTGAPTCARGVLNLSKGSGGSLLIVYTLTARFDQYAMVAYAHLVYASTRDKLGATAVCAGQTGQAGEQEVDMVSGCAADSCTSPVDSAGPTVTAFESSVVGAAKQHNPKSWQAVWKGASRALTAQYGSDRFGSLIEGQAQKKGHIKSITPSNVSPQVQFDSAGQAYFTVTDSVALDMGGGNTSTVTVTSYYLLESGQWVFWFSMPVQS